MNRIKNGIIIIILTSFLLFVALMPVTCIFKTVTGIFCPACGMTRSFIAILHFDFIEAAYQNLFGIPFAIFLAYFFIFLIKDFIQNRFSFIPKLLDFFGKHYIFILILLLISFTFNNLKFLII